MSEENIEIDARELMSAIDTSIYNATDKALTGYLFYFKECMNDILADLTVINHELGLLRRHLEMNKSIALSLHQIED